MHWVHPYLFDALWIAFMVYWRISSFGNKTALRLEPMGSRLLRVILFVVAIGLMFRGPFSWLNDVLYPQTRLIFWIGVGLTLAGMLFCVWARLTLGRNWSGTVALKQDHELITGGPYRLVRHPIYTGLLLAFLGTDLGIAQTRAVVAFLLILIAFILKWRLEERWMHEQFGSAYADYAQRTPAIVPLLY